MLFKHELVSFGLCAYNEYFIHICSSVCTYNILHHNGGKIKKLQ